MAKTFSDKYQGTLKEGEENLLSNIEKIAYDHVIVGSDSWRGFEQEIMQKRIDHYGAICISVSISLPVKNDVLASCLVQSALVVSVELKGSSTMEMETQYFVHINHLADQDCDDSCVKVKLEDYLPGILDLSTIETQFLGTHLSSIQLKMHSFVRNFLKSPNSNLSSENFSIRINYQPDGKILLTGFTWPRVLDQLNNEFANYPSKTVKQEIIKEAIKFIDSNISVSTKSSDIQSQFDVSEYEAGKIADLSKKVQAHYCGQLSCKSCSNPGLPSLKTAFTLCPDSEFSQNIDASFRFREYMIQKFKFMDSESRRSKSTKEWLTETLSCVKGITDDERRTWRINVDGNLVTFLVDKRLMELLEDYHDEEMLALYQYSLCCRDFNESFQVILQTKYVRDCYTKPYQVDLLKAFESELEVCLVNGYLKQREIECSEQHNLDIPPLDDQFKMTHRVISLGEAYSLLDRNLERTSNSTSHEHISANPERKLFFKKVMEKNEDTFQAEGQHGYFEKQRSNIEKYLDRRNGSHVTLTEFCSNYDFTGREESRQICKLFSKNEEVTINDSELKSAYDPDKCLPELIVTSQGEVMKIRTKPKVITYPQFADSDKEMYRRVLMFYPLSKDPKKDEVLTLSKKANDSDRGQVPIIDKVERALFPKKNFSFVLQ